MSKILDTIKTAIKGEEKEFTTGSINRAIVLLAIPMILEMVMESLFAVVDAYFVGKVSTQAVAIVGLTEAVVTVVYSIAMGMAMAATAMISRRIGEKHFKKAGDAAAQSILMAGVVSLLVGVLGIIYAEDILGLMGGSPELIESGKWYTKIIFGSNIVITFLFLLNGVFRGAGNANIAMVVLTIANVLNIILDPLFIFGIGPFPELGVTGAAVATSCGRGIAVLIQLYILFTGKSLVKINWESFRIQWNVIKKLGDVALTGAWQWIIASASWIFLMAIIADFGETIVAGYTFSIRIIIFTILPSWGMANAAATLVGQNLGAGKPDRAASSVWRSSLLNTVFLTSIGIIFFFAADWVLGIFSNDPEVIAAGVLSLRIFCVGYIFFAPGMVISQAFNGAGDTRTPMLINIVCFWMIEIPLAYFLAKMAGWGPAGVYWAIAIAEAVLAIICIYVFRQGRWKTVQI